MPRLATYRPSPPRSRQTPNSTGILTLRLMQATLAPSQAFCRSLFLRPTCLGHNSPSLRLKPTRHLESTIFLTIKSVCIFAHASYRLISQTYPRDTTSKCPRCRFSKLLGIVSLRDTAAHCIWMAGCIPSPPLFLLGFLFDEIIYPDLCVTCENFLPFPSPSPIDYLVHNDRSSPPALSGSSSNATCSIAGISRGRFI